MGPLGFTQRVLWLLFIDADQRATTFLTQVERLPEQPEVELLRNVMRVAAHVLGSTVVDGSLALLLSRPGRGQLTHDDRGWARGLTYAAAEVRLPLHPIHIATCDEIRRFTPDDLIPSASESGPRQVNGG
jgi:hypothetical protein